MGNSGGNHFAFTCKDRRVKLTFEELKANYGRVFLWLSTMQSSGLLLSETGYKNVAARFNLKPDELKEIIETFQKGAGHG